MKIALLVFPGSNATDCYHALGDIIEGTATQSVTLVWHTETDLSQYDAFIVPGGFSYGDYLRSGAIARYAPVIDALVQAAEQGKPIMGIGNGFQILLEAGLLPGTLRRNESLKFHCNDAKLKVVNNNTPFTAQYEQEEDVHIPIAHETGNYYCDEHTLQQLERNNQIIFKYMNHNPNGSVADIAGICNEQGNVMGMMPHPERATNALLGSEDGKRLFTSLLNSWEERHGTATIG